MLDEIADTIHAALVALTEKNDENEAYRLLEEAERLIKKAEPEVGFSLAGIKRSVDSAMVQFSEEAPMPKSEREFVTLCLDDAQDDAKESQKLVGTKEECGFVGG